MHLFTGRNADFSISFVIARLRSNLDLRVVQLPPQGKTKMPSGARENTELFTAPSSANQ